MDQNTTLFVIGDHGMTTTGDHGGESENEITAAMFVYSKTRLSQAYYEHNNTIKQVDLVPTLATIFGIPIPYSNLGSIVYDALPSVSLAEPNWHYALFASWSNAQQLTSYIRDYSKSTNTFDEDKLGAIYKNFDELKLRLNTIISEDDFQSFASDLNDYIKFVRAMCEEVWIQFDAFSMARGLLLISHVTIFLFLLVEGLPNSTLEEIISTKIISICYLSVIISTVGSGILYYTHLVSDLFNTIYFGSGLCSVGILATISVQNFEAISLRLHEFSKKRRWPDILCRIVLSFSAVMLFSNSFILEEAKVMLFFLLTLVFALLLEFGFLKLSKQKEITIKSLTKSKVLVFALIICVLIRISMYFWRCREEQGCNDYGLSKGVSTGRLEWIMTVVSLSLFVSASRIWLRTCGNLNGFSITVLLAKYAPTVIVVCGGGFWILHRLPKDVKIQLLGPWQPDMLAWIIYALTLIGFGSLFFQPLCIFQLQDKKEIEVDTRQPNLIPQLAKYVFANLESKTKPEIPMVFGLATVYSAVFILVGVYFTLLWTLLLGDVVVPSCIALTFVVALVLVISAILKYERSQSIQDLLDMPSTTVLIWFIMSIYLFYGTGHQPTFPNIAWEAAFVGTGGVFTYNIIPATLVTINTFGSYFFMGLTLPLILISPFTVYVIYPALSHKKSKIDLSRGELALYDNDKIAFRNVFKLCCKYIVCHTLRVFCIMLASTIHCRHLMVWNIFAPKLIFECIGLLVTLVSVSLSYLLFIHINNKVDNFMKYLNKQFS